MDPYRKFRTILFLIVLAEVTAQAAAKGLPEDYTVSPKEAVREAQERLEEVRRDVERSMKEWRALPQEEREARLKENYARARARQRDSALQKAASLRRRKTPLDERAAEDARRLAWHSSIKPYQREAESSRPKEYIDQWEFRGLLKMGEHSEFSLHNPWEDTKLWLGLGETRSDLKVMDYDPVANTLQIQSGDETRTLPLKSSSSGAEGRLEAGSGVERQREYFDLFYEKWLAAVGGSEELQRIQEEYNRIGDALETRLDNLPTLGSKNWWQAEKEVIATLVPLLDEAHKLAESTMEELRKDPSFDESEILEAGVMSIPLALGRYFPYPR